MTHRDDLRALEHAVAQLRHAYANLKNGGHPRGYADWAASFADGLIGPQIKVFERHLRALAAAQETPQDTRQIQRVSMGQNRVTFKLNGHEQSLAFSTAADADKMWGLLRDLVAHGTPAARPAETLQAIIEMLPTVTALNERVELFRIIKLLTTPTIVAERPRAPHATKRRDTHCIHEVPLSVDCYHCDEMAATEPGAPTR